MAAIILATTDDTTAPADVIADAIAGTITEVYPDNADPVWVNPTGAVVIDPAIIALILDAAVVGLEGSEEARADEAWDAVQTLRANLPL